MKLYRMLREELIHLLNILKDNSWILLTAIGTFLIPIQPLLLLIGGFIILDTIFGLIKARKIGEPISSRKASHLVSKMLLYQLTIITFFSLDFYLLSEISNLFVSIDYLLTKVVALVLILIEAKSINENIEIAFNINLWDEFKYFLTRAIELKKEVKELTKDENDI